MRTALAKMREQIGKSEAAAAKITQARGEAEMIVWNRRQTRPNTAGQNFDFAVQRELDASQAVQALISTDQLARSRAQMYSLQATADLLEHLADVAERLERRIDTTQSYPVPHQRHAG